jgi:methionine-rich copper-binding protein CopC
VSKFARAAIATVVLATGLTALIAARPPAEQRWPAVAAPAVSVVSASPADGATVASAPAEVELAFNVPVDVSRSHVSVVDSGGIALNGGESQLVGAERLRQPIRAATGDVTAAYHVTFVDGSTLTGTLLFHVGAGVPSAERPADAAAHEHGIDPLSAVLLTLDGVVFFGAIVLLMARPRRPSGRGTAPR